MCCSAIPAYSIASRITFGCSLAVVATSITLKLHSVHPGLLVTTILTACYQGKGDGDTVTCREH